MKLPKLKYNSNLKSLLLKASDREKKLLAVLAILILIVISYYLLYRPLDTVTQRIQTEKNQMDVKVTAAKSDLANEYQISQDYEEALAQANKVAAGFFPKVYPYKDRYLVMLENVVKASGATAQMVVFDDPEVGEAPLPEKDKQLVLPAYPLLDLAQKINAAAQPGNTPPQQQSTAADNTEAAKNTKAAAKTLPSDAVLRLPATLEVQGSYAQIKAVITNLEKLDRKIAIEGVTIQKDIKETYQRATLSLAFYAVEKVDNGADSFNAWTIKGSYGKADIFN